MRLYHKNLLEKRREKEKINGCEDFIIYVVIRIKLWILGNGVVGLIMYDLSYRSEPAVLHCSLQLLIEAKVCTCKITPFVFQFWVFISMDTSTSYL